MLVLSAKGIMDEDQAEECTKQQKKFRIGACKSRDQWY